MPILYPIAAGFFIVGYWVDKILLLRFNRKPPAYDETLAKGSLLWYKWILVMHVVMGTIMYSNSSICPSKYVIINTSNELLAQAVAGWKIQNFFQLHIVLFLGMMIVIGLVLFFWSTVAACLNCLTRLCGVETNWEAQRFEEENPQYDFYSCVKLETLIDEYNLTEDLKKKYKKEKNHHVIANYDIDPFIQSLIKKQNDIVREIERRTKTTLTGNHTMEELEKLE